MSFWFSPLEDLVFFPNVGSLFTSGKTISFCCKRRYLSLLSLWEFSNGQEIQMKYVTAMLSAVFIFICVGLLSGIFLALVCPKSWFEIELNLGFLTTNVPSLIAILIASSAATHTFRASLRAKTFKLHQKKRDEKDDLK